MRTRTISIDGQSCEVEAAFLSQILQRAAEGGCSYWADISARRLDDEGGLDNVQDFDVSDYVEDEEDDDEAEPFYAAVNFYSKEDASQGGTIDLDGVADAIERIAEGEVNVPPAIRAIIVAAVQHNSMDDIDAEAADCIVQVGLFDEVVFH